MSLVKTVGRFLPVALSLAVLVACGDKKEEKPVPVKQPEPVKVEAPAPAPEPEKPAPFDFSKFAAIKNNSNVYLTTRAEVDAYLKDAFDKVEKGQASSIMFPNVSSLFELASAELSSEGRAIIASLASKYGQTNQEATLLVEGYTCDLGSVPFNDELSQRRAENVKAEIAKYIPASKITAKWYGKRMFKKFKFDTKDEYRRVNIRIQ
ncbi:OmpA family protein [Fibrobacter sp.]|uniref:OmpA family protein n=1 Tax=Fibrobacter sp. TaxID=35828 RepID=UPI0025C1F834|nr:OmpA family protein [Fibrobacter sp.]MBR3072026.1 OmpA family protein [Fibrobacter sp.]